MPQNNGGFFSNFFGGSNNGAQPNGESADPNQQQGQQPGQQQSGGGQDPNQPSGQQQQGQQPNGQQSTKEQDPFDIYNKMFENTDSGDTDAPPSLSIGKDTLQQVTGQLDFVSGLDQATLDQLQNGDLSSLPTLLNNVARQVYSTAMQHNAALTNEFVNKRSEYDSTRIAPTVKSTLTQARLDSDLGDLSKQPAMKAQMTETAERLARAYPDATPEWIATQAKQYVIQSAAQLMGVTPEQLKQLQSSNAQQSQQSAQNVDWSTYFDRPNGSN